VTYISLEFVRRTEGEPDLRVIKSEIIADKTDRNEGVISFVTIGEVVVAGNKYQYLVVVVKHKLYKKDAPWIISKAYLSPPEPFQDPRDKDVVALWRQRAVDLLD
jgi:hypothetical protein